MTLIKRQIQLIGNRVILDAEGLARIPDGGLDGVIEAAEECPGECIFIDVGE